MVTFLSNYDEAKKNLEGADRRLRGWEAACNDPKKFQPIMRAEYGRAFDKREKLFETACRADPDRFAADYPDSAWLAVYLGLRAAPVNNG